PMSQGIARSVGLLPGAGTPEGLLTWCVAGTVLLFVLTWAAGLGVALANLGCGQRMVYDLQADLFGHMQRLSLRFHSRKPVGDLVRRVATDCGCMATIVKDALLPVLVSLAALGAMFSIMWRLDPLLTLLALAVVPCMILVFWRYVGPMT